MRRVSRTMSLAVVTSLSLFGLAACGGDDGGSKSGGDNAITVYGCNPEEALIPQNTAETCGGDVLDVTTAKLVHYNVETAEPENDIAESIETTDNQTFTVKIKPGYLFNDGTEVKASSFVDAWNYAAYQPNGYAGSYFFTPIEGYAEVQCQETDDEGACTKDPKVDTMSGLVVVDDYTFTIKTSEKVSNLPVRLGYTAFSPLPESFFTDPAAFGDKPVSAGPYYVEQWDKTKQIVLKKNPDYSGEFAGNVDEITFRVYTSVDAAYKDIQSGKLDVINQIPTGNLPTFEKELPGRTASEEVGVFQAAGFAAKADPQFGNPDVRKAISMAIDRETITQQIFDGTRTPATGWVSPVVDGFKAGACGEFCEYDPEAAKALLEKAGGFKGDIQLWVNGDGDHGPWAEAACNSIRQALDVECTAKITKDFDELLAARDKREAGFFRSGWQMDYPSIENFLAPLYGTGADSNDVDYSNPEMDKKLVEAAAASTPEEANALYQEAEALLAVDMPTIPLWYSTAQAAWSERIDGVEINPFGVPDYAGIKLK